MNLTSTHSLPPTCNGNSGRFRRNGEGKLNMQSHLKINLIKKLNNPFSSVFLHKDSQPLRGSSPLSVSLSRSPGTLVRRFGVFMIPGNVGSCCSQVSRHKLLSPGHCGHPGTQLNLNQAHCYSPTVLVSPHYH